MAVSRQWLETLPAPHGVLQKLQQRGRNALTKNELPTNSLEAWRLTDLKRLEKLFSLTVVTKSEIPLKPFSNSWVKSPKNGFRIVMDPQRDPLEGIILPDGIRPLTPLELEQNLGQVLKSCLCSNDWPIAINNASATNLLALKVEGQDLPPLELITEATQGTFVPSRIILILEEKAKLELLQITLGKQDSAHSHLLEVHLGKEAELNHGWVALGSGEGNLLANLTIEQEEKSNYSLTSVQHGWSLGRLEPRVVQVGGEATTTLKGLQISTGSQQLATHSAVRFDGPEGVLDQLHKTAASGHSHCIFNGEIDVPKIAQRTNAAQLSRNLLMSTRARIDTKPELEIVADDVRCTHGATVSQLQEDELFYMRSRGINSKAAATLLLKGYCQEILDNLPVEANRWGILNQLLESVK